jgi:hypothetical protein
MKLKRIFKPREQDGDPLVFDYIAIGDTGIHREQTFTRERIRDLAVLGGAVIEGRTLILKTHPEPLVFEILCFPGCYCCHCGALIESIEDYARTINTPESGAKARAHVAEKHAGVPSPDTNWPAGYKVTHAYACVLDAAQHERYKAVANKPVVYRTKEA